MAMKTLRPILAVALAVWCASFAVIAQDDTNTDTATPQQSPEAKTEKRIECLDDPPAFRTDGESMTWHAGDGAFTLDCYCKIGPLMPQSRFTVFQRCRLSFASNGTLECAELLPERVRIESSCLTNKVSGLVRDKSSASKIQ